MSNLEMRQSPLVPLLWQSYKKVHAFQREVEVTDIAGEYETRLCIFLKEGEAVLENNGVIWQGLPASLYRYSDEEVNNINRYFGEDIFLNEWELHRKLTDMQWVHTYHWDWKKQAEKAVW